MKTSYERNVKEDRSNTMGIATSYLSEETKVVYEKEIPLVIQIMTSKNQVAAYGVDYFEHPEEYERHGYEEVYAVTIKFSQKKLK